jgi:hypothetical protein
MNPDRPITCCKAIPGAASQDVAGSMIEQALITEYYDGAISGFIQCSSYSSLFSFVTLDWSQSHWVRVIALSRLPPDSLTRLLSFFAEVPASAQWIPKVLQRPSDQELDRIEAFVTEITASAEPPSIVMAWNVRTNEILSARNVGPMSPDHFVSLFAFDAPAPPKQYDWFADLAVARDR